MKAILILDETPAECLVCNFRGVRDCYYCTAENALIPRIIDDIFSRPDWCPLRPLPERKAEMDYLATGFNKCLDEIEGVDV